MAKIANAINLNDSGIAIFNAPMGRFFGRTLTLIGSSISIINPDGVGGNPDFSIITTNTINDFAGILSVEKGGTGVGTLTQNAVLIGDEINPIITSLGTNGQLLIGATGAAPAFSTLGVVGGLTLTSGPNALTLKAPSIIIAGIGVNIVGSPVVSLGGSIAMTLAGVGTTWVPVLSTNQTIESGKGYIASNVAQVVFTLPSRAEVGDIFYITGNNSAGVSGWTIKMRTGQKICSGNICTTAGTGSLSSTFQTDSILAVCITGGNNSAWNIIDCIGNINLN